MDSTINLLSKLYKALQSQGFSFISVSDIVKQINNLGHEIGYHYDDLTLCRGNYDFVQLKDLRKFEYA